MVLGSDRPREGTSISKTAAVPSVSDLLFIGVVGRPHGLKGAFFISSRSDALPQKYKTIFIGNDPASIKTADVKTSRMQGDRPVIQCTLSASREDAEKLTGKRIYVHRSLAHQVFSKEVLWADLVKCQVVSAAGTPIGTIADLYDNGATGVIQIKGLNGDTADIPMVQALFDLANVERIRSEKILVCLLPDEAIAAYWSRELAKGEQQ